MPTIGTSRRAVWGVRSLVKRKRLLRYALRSTVGATVSLRFSVAAVVARVAIARRAAWLVRRTAGGQRRVLWRFGSAPASSASGGFRARPSAFARVRVRLITLEVAHISWELAPHFLEPRPYLFELQVGNTGLGQADDWETVGLVEDEQFLADTRRRWFGKTRTVHYRVKLRTAAGSTYYSDPVPALGDLEDRDWRLVQEIIRKERIYCRRGAGINGYLLKRKRQGTACPRCLNLHTGLPRDARCPVCFGTQFVGGYHPALYNVWMELSLGGSRERRDASRHMVKEEMVLARGLGLPGLETQDVWVYDTANARYLVHDVLVAAAVRGFPFICNLRLKLLPPEDAAYLVPLS